MNKIKSIAAAMAGTALEFYDLTLYGFFSSLLAPLFFPNSNPTISLMASLGAFAAGFIMRPLGGIFFGYVGDRYGRKRALVIAILCVTWPTVTIGLVPSYAEIGIAAPLLIIFCRLLQGFCVGGEYSGAAVFVIEQVKMERAGFAGSLLCAAAFLGAIIGLGIAAVCTASFMPLWGWRIPFIMGGVFGLVAYFFRRQIQETASFHKMQRSTLPSSSPLQLIFKKRKLNFICTVAIGSSAQVPFYIVSIYMQILMTSKLMLSPSYALLISTAIMGLWMVLLPLTGLLADRFGCIKVMSYSATALLISVYPLFFLLEHFLSLSTILFVQILISFAGVGFMGAAPGLLPRLFPVEERVSGTAFGFSLGQALFSGVTPLIATALVMWSGDPKAPAFYLMLTSLAGWLAVNGAHRLLAPQKDESLYYIHRAGSLSNTF
jgi:MHS family proline/betaine transporter-like MFS transporter